VQNWTGIQSFQLMPTSASCNGATSDYVQPLPQQDPDTYTNSKQKKESKNKHTRLVLSILAAAAVVTAFILSKGRSKGKSFSLNPHTSQEFNHSKPEKMDSGNETHSTDKLMKPKEAPHTDTSTVFKEKAQVKPSTVEASFINNPRDQVSQEKLVNLSKKLTERLRTSNEKLITAKSAKELSDFKHEHNMNWENGLEEKYSLNYEDLKKFHEHQNLESEKFEKLYSQKQSEFRRKISQDYIKRAEKQEEEIRLAKNPDDLSHVGFQHVLASDYHPDHIYADDKQELTKLRDAQRTKRTHLLEQKKVELEVQSDRVFQQLKAKDTRLTDKYFDEITKAKDTKALEEIRKKISQDFGTVDPEIEHLSFIHKLHTTSRRNITKIYLESACQTGKFHLGGASTSSCFGFESSREYRLHLERGKELKNNTSPFVPDILACQNENDLKKCYRKAALKYHPDKNKSEEAESIFKDINAANEWKVNDMNYEALRQKAEKKSN
jgi:DnaJ domain